MFSTAVSCSVCWSHTFCW